MICDAISSVRPEQKLFISISSSTGSSFPPGKTQAPPKFVLAFRLIIKTSTLFEGALTSSTVAAGLGTEGSAPGSAFLMFTDSCLDKMSGNSWSFAIN